MQQSETTEASQEAPVMGRITFGDMYLELPAHDAHTANRKILGV